jgi:hypothetical protein
MQESGEWNRAIGSNSVVASDVRCIQEHPSGCLMCVDVASAAHFRSERQRHLLTPEYGWDTVAPSGAKVLP